MQMFFGIWGELSKLILGEKVISNMVKIVHIRHELDKLFHIVAKKLKYFQKIRDNFESK